MAKNLQLHFLNASGSLTKNDINILTDYIEDVFIKIDKKISVSDIDYVVKNDPDRTIEDTGVCGNAYEKDQVILYIDKDFKGFPASIKDELQATIAHETHHVIRERKGVYGATLLDVMVAEGLADHFSEEVMGSKNMWHNRVYAKVPNMISRAKKELHNDNFDYPAWFFGSETQKIPKYTGYAMGYKLVARYLESKNETAVGNVATPSDKFVGFVAK